MNLIKIKDFTEADYTGTQYKVDGPFNIDDIIDLLSSFVNSKTTLYECTCDTFTEEGLSRTYRFREISQLKNMHNFPNPSIGIHAIYIDRKTKEYKFEISTAANTKIVDYTISDSVRRYVKRRMELDRMEEEAAVNRKQEAKMKK